MNADRPHYRTRISDSARWQDFAFRPGDIIICTPPKCGTTWMQMICALLIFQDPDLDRPLSQLSPWLDMLIHTRAEVFARLEAQPHRRFIKTHTPLDGLPLREEVTYICVGRDPRDVAMSMLGHRENMDYETLKAAVERVVRLDGLDAFLLPEPPPLAETLEERFWQWMDNDIPFTRSGSSLRFTLHHFEEALRARDQANVVVMHYSHLQADTEGEMRRLADRLGIVVPEKSWPRLVEAALFESMRARAANLAPDARLNFWKEPEQFFHSGGGRWRAFFDDLAQRRYEAHVSVLTSPEVAVWAHSGWWEPER
ncbi:MAG TPA: sulfotransferase domain-containing protein [Chthonomonadaceae bacterium]|nr:sulfotransferase domain-containing protein [Chthonomonadaceae bacterium]